MSKGKISPVYDNMQFQGPDNNVEMENNPAYRQAIPHDKNMKKPDPAYEELSTHSDARKPAEDINYYQNVINA